MTAHRDDAACTGAGVRNPSQKLPFAALQRYVRS